ncbi:S8 family peptidase [Enemella dayhoffiae]|uniref:S8 family peptidase n=1 Tax=Enemella dayhoffiae TaxID=2016507 RepID=UPI001595A174|nr:S8 family serine peptidase [Enemella dayhoffiae]
MREIQRSLSRRGTSASKGRQLGAILATGLLLAGLAVPAYAVDGEGEPFDPAICADYAANGAEAEKDPHWATKRLQVDKVHQLATGKGIRIAVLDTGVDTSRNPALLREGRPTVTRTYNFAGYDKGPRGNGNERRADCSHGTQVASLIVGTAEPGGFVGLAPDAEVISMRTLQKAAPSKVNTGQEPEREPLEPTIKAIRKAIELRVDIINISQQGSDSFEYRRAITDAAAAGIVIVGAAGNEGASNQAPYPGSYRDVIAVGMSDINDQPHPQSQFHPQMTVSVGAPGVAVLAANPSGPQGQSWSTVDGTSFAAPLVSATVALMLERNRRLTPQQVRRRLEASADPPASAVPDKQLGHGVISPYRALTDVDFATPGPSPTPQGGRAPDPTRPASTTRGGKLAVVLGVAALGGIGLATALFAAYPSGRRRGWKV